MVMNSEHESKLILPQFALGGLVRQTRQFRVLMDWKPGLERQKGGERFFIEPLTDEAQRMLRSAADVHYIANFNVRSVESMDGVISQRECLRADFSEANLPVLLRGEVKIPKEGEDTVPSIERMEECLRLHLATYTFSD